MTKCQIDFIRDAVSEFQPTKEVGGRRKKQNGKDRIEDFHFDFGEC